MTAQVASQAAARVSRPAGSGGAPILAAKITAPGVPDWVVPRPRITKLIARGRRWCPLTVITAPAGAGKTMALALWAAAEPGPVAWAGLDESGNRPGAFWPYVAAALRRSGVAVPAPPPAGRGGTLGACSCGGWRRSRLPITASPADACRRHTKTKPPSETEHPIWVWPGHPPASLTDAMTSHRTTARAHPAIAGTHTGRRAAHDTRNPASLPQTPSCGATIRTYPARHRCLRRDAACPAGR